MQIVDKIIKIVKSRGQSFQVSRFQDCFDKRQYSHRHNEPWMDAANRNAIR